MNHCRILYFFAPVLLLMAACTQVNVSQQTKLSVEAVDLSTSSATVNLILIGDMPSACRFADPVLKSEYDATKVPEADLCAYLDEHGKAVKLPAAVDYDDLQPSSEYLVIVECTSGGQKKYTVGQFKTLAPSEFSLAISMEDKVFAKGDKAGVVSYDKLETFNENVVADFAYNTSGDGAVFLPSSELQLPQLGQERFYVYYPYNKSVWLDESDFCLHSTVPDVQDGEDSDVLLHAWGICDINNKSTNVQIGIIEALCKLNLDINLSEYPGYGLRSVSIFDSKGKAFLSGEYAVDPEKNVVKAVTGKSNTSVSAKKAALSDGKISFTLIPGDYREGDIILLVYLENASGVTHTVPVRYEGDPLDLHPGDVKNVRIESLKAAENPYPWFEYNDSRDFLDGNAYGAQNTFLVESGKSVTFDVKARGDVLKAKAPKYYGIMLASNLKNEKLLQMPDGTDAYEPQPERPIPDDYKITVNCLSGTGASFGVVAIFDENHTVLWSFMIWKYESGDPVGSVSYSGMSDCAFMDRALGARKSIAAALRDGKALEGAAYFSWGRKDPFPWKNQVPPHYLIELGEGHDLQYAIEHPNVNLQDVSSGPGYWYGNGSDKPMRKDLWGAENRTTSENRNIKGHKTIYDPCPEGYRVPDYGALCNINDRKHLAEIVFTSSDKRYDLQNDPAVNHLELPCPFSDMSAFAIMKTDGNYDYWLYHGNLWADSGWTNATTDANKASYCYWSNTNQTTSKWRASILRGWYNGGGTKWFFDTSDRMAGAYPVRCQKEN